MNARLLRLAADLLERASDKFSNHGCNDFSLPDDMPQAEVADLVDAYNVMNLGPNREDWDDGQVIESTRDALGDFMLMSLLADMFEKEADLLDEAREG